MFRTLIIIAAIALVFMLVKNRLRDKAGSRRPGADPSNTVKCLQCNTYVPVDEAISSDNHHFCCRQHQRDWQDTQRRDG